MNIIRSRRTRRELFTYNGNWIKRASAILVYGNERIKNAVKRSGRIILPDTIVVGGIEKRPNVSFLTFDIHTGVLRMVFGGNVIVDNGEAKYAGFVAGTGATQCYTQLGEQESGTFNPATSYKVDDPIENDNGTDPLVDIYPVDSTTPWDYPKAPDTDPDNPSPDSGNNIVTWRTSYTLQQACSASPIWEVGLLTVNAAPAADQSQTISLAKLTTPVTKGNTNIMKSFINHKFLGA